MQLQEFCEHVHILTKNNIIIQGSNIENIILNKILNSDNASLKK